MRDRYKVKERRRRSIDLGRREFLQASLAVAGAAFLPVSADVNAQSVGLLQKKIPSSGELIPIIGLGTARRYEEIHADAEKIPLRATIAKFKEVGLKVVDSSPSYGTAEAVVGELVEGQAPGAKSLRCHRLPFKSAWLCVIADPGGGPRRRAPVQLPRKFGEPRPRLA